MDYVATDVSYKLTCKLPCRSCNPPSELDKCLDCYPEAISVNNKWDKENFTCISDCEEGKYDDGTGNCLPCGNFC